MNPSQMNKSKAAKVTASNSGKSQSAIEYLMTYSWTILITAIVLGLLYFLGAFTPATNAPHSAACPGS